MPGHILVVCPVSPHEKHWPVRSFSDVHCCLTCPVSRQRKHCRGRGGRISTLVETHLILILPTAASFLTVVTGHWAQTEPMPVFHRRRIAPILILSLEQLPTSAIASTTSCGVIESSIPLILISAFFIGREILISPSSLNSWRRRSARLYPNLTRT